MSESPYQSMLVEPVIVDLTKYLGKRDHSVSEQWHRQGPPSHLTTDPTEGTLVAPHCEAITMELIGFMEEYYWRVDNGTQEELWKAMFTPHAMYNNNGFKMINHGFADAAKMDRMFKSPWLKHQMDRVCITPTWNATGVDDTGPVLVHVLGSHWNGKKETTDKAKQSMEATFWPFSQTFEIVKYNGEWKMNRVLLMMHDNLLGLKKAIQT